MTTYEKCHSIRHLIVNRAAEVISYVNWPAEFATKRLRELPEIAGEKWEELADIQPCELTDQECESLGFGKWSKDNPMRLIPLWLFPFLPEEIRTTCIDGSTVLRKSEMDNDHRFGCVAYGIIPKQEANQCQ